LETPVRRGKEEGVAQRKRSAWLFTLHPERGERGSQEGTGGLLFLLRETGGTAAFFLFCGERKESFVGEKRQSVFLPLRLNFSRRKAQLKEKRRGSFPGVNPLGRRKRKNEKKLGVFLRERDGKKRKRGRNHQKGVLKKSGAQCLSSLFSQKRKKKGENQSGGNEEPFCSSLISKKGGRGEGRRNQQRLLLPLWGEKKAPPS